MMCLSQNEDTRSIPRKAQLEGAYFKAANHTYVYLQIDLSHSDATHIISTPAPSLLHASRRFRYVFVFKASAR